MATKNKHPRRKWRRPDAQAKPPPEREQAQAPAAAPAEQAQPSNVIRKGIYLSALVYLEGDMPAPDDFISPATKALKSALEEALKGEHDGLSMTLKKVEVRNDIEQDEEEEEEGDGKEEKFQF
ncbi:MAG TPA: hypothetical protein VND68_00385 [Chloroflexia bacterium]|jgi:hypothetical protein|nr:hypothetical protein [Chloroflexia bacterium]